MKSRLRLFILISALFLSGCVEKEILDDINLERAVAYDYLKGDRVRGSVIVPVFLPDQSVKNVMYTASSSFGRDFLRDMQRQSEQPLVTGSLEVALFGEKMAERGIIEMIDSFQRDSGIGSRLYLCVTEGDARNILEGKYGERGKAIYISNMIAHNIKDRDLPDTNLQMFLFDYYQKGQTGFLPVLSKTEDDKVEISGISLFKKDKAVDFISPDEMFFFKIMVDRYSEGHQNVKAGGKEAIIRSIKTKHKMELVQKDPFEIVMKIKVKGNILEYSGSRLSPKEIEKIKVAFEKKIKRECEKLVARFLEKEIDPAGFGHFAKTQIRGFDFKKWDSQYQNLKVTVRAEMTITEAGVIE